jgi:uncharacterized protein (DUF488 family)
MTDAFYTIGHSTRPLDEFLALLKGAGIARLIDVRTIPRSRRNPQYGTETLAAALAAAGIIYQHEPALGGLRKKQPGVPPERNAYWRNASFHNYADYALSEEFQGALQRLRALGHRERCAIMCAEAHFSQCHRQIIADHLMGAGERVLHIVKQGEIVEGRLNPGAHVSTGGTVTYPGSAQASLFPGQDPP